MFNLFSKKSKGPKDQFIAYASKMLKYKHVLQSFKSNADEERVLLVYFFDQTNEEVTKLCGALDILVSNDPGNLTSPGYVLMCARDLEGVNIDQVDKVLALEAHPQATINGLVGEKFKDSNMDHIVFYIGLDEPLFTFFGGDRIANMLNKMGLEEGEPIEHSMINKSIHRAQERIDSLLDFPKDVRSSQEEWAEANDIAGKH